MEMRMVWLSKMCEIEVRNPGDMNHCFKLYIKY